MLGDGRLLSAPAIVVTTGTFLGGKLFTGLETRPGGRVGAPPALSLSRSLASLGLRMARLKTGTPPRLDGRTIAWASVERSEERRVGKEWVRTCRSRWSPYHYKNKRATT